MKTTLPIRNYRIYCRVAHKDLLQMKHHFPFCVTLTILILTVTAHFSFAKAQSIPPLVVGNFSNASETSALPEGWEPMLFKKIKSHTQYRLTKDNDTVVISAQSHASSSGLIRRLTIDPKQYPVVQWRWKVDNILASGDVTKKSGDDYSARLYITFAYDGSKLGFFEKAKFNAAKAIYGEYPPMGAINYIWAGKAEKGRSIPNAYTSRVIMVVVESGKENVGKWVTEKRNIYEDYKKAFGHEPPMISGIAIMTDTDNTGESATAYYGDIIFTQK